MDVFSIVDSWVVRGDLKNIQLLADMRAVTSCLTSIVAIERDVWDAFLFLLMISNTLMFCMVLCAL